MSMSDSERLAEINTQTKGTNERLAWDSEVSLLREKLAASEAAAGQMRAALEKIDKGLDDAGEDPYIYGEVTARDEACQALATDAGRGWVSPEEAERLRKELEFVRTQQRIADNFTGYVSSEECVRRCREVALAWEDYSLWSEGSVPAPLDANDEAKIAAIIERVAKGKP